MSTNPHTDELVPFDPVALDRMASGEEFSAADYLALALIGLVLPVALLVWGWL